MTTCEALPGENCQAELPLWQEATHASRLAPQESKGGKTTLATCGQKCGGSCMKCDPIGWLEKTLLATLPSGLMKSYGTWKPKATPRGRFAYRLVVSARGISASGYSLLPTALTTYDGRSMEAWKAAKARAKAKHAAGGYGKGCGAPGMMDLQRAVSPMDGSNGRLSPDWTEWFMGLPVGWTDIERSETP